MGLVNRVKQNISDTVELARDGVEEVKELREKREVTHMYGDLGKKVFELIEQGELSHPSLEPELKEIRKTIADREYIKGAGSSRQAAGAPTAPTRDDI